MTLRAYLKASAVLAVAAASVFPAQAQQVKIEEIVVTAKQRSENLQSVPLAITALTRETLDARGVTDLRDLAVYAPGFTYHSASGRKDMSAMAMRGLAPNTVNPQLQGISSFYNGVYTGGSVNLVEFSQIERVEVLKGPQSTSFGRATYSGAIDYITRTPKVDKVGGKLRAELSNNQGAEAPSFSVTASVDVPLVQDKIWANAFGNFKKVGALYNSPGLNIPIGEEKTESAGLTIYAEPGENFNVKFLGLYDLSDDSPSLVHMQHPQEWRAAGLQLGPSVTPNAVWLDDNVPAPILGSTECVTSRRLYIPECGSYKERYFLSGIFTYDMDGYELSYRGGYYHEDSKTNYDTTSRGSTTGVDPFFGTAAQGVIRKSGLGTSQLEYFEGFSHQLRIVSPSEQDLRWRAGAYYFKERDTNFSETFLTAANPTGRPRGDENIENYAGFAAVAYDLGSQFTLDLEGRLQHENIIWEGCSFCSATSSTRNTLTEGSTEFLPRVTLSYKPSDDILLFALYSYGTKSGRFNTASVTQFRFVEPEKLSNYEIGAKTTSLDGRLVLNGAAFIQRVKDQQFVSRDAVNPTVTYSQNIGKSNIWGFETDGILQATDVLRLTGSLSYAHHKYASFSAPPVEAAAVSELLNGQSLQGKTSVNVPRWNAAVGGVYTIPQLMGENNLDLQADVTYRGKSFADGANRATYKAVTRLNLRTTLSNDFWQTSLFMRDVFDNKRPLGGASGATSCVYAVGLPANLVTATAINNQRCLAVVVPRGREIGISASVTF